MKTDLKFGTYIRDDTNKKIDQLRLMIVSYITSKSKVLEIGSGVGKNSCLIAEILEDSKKLVTLETNPEIISQLEVNKTLNDLNFQIESYALSKRNLIQKDDITIESENLLEGYFPVNIISWEKLQRKYKINFDTLVIDCNDAFYNILQDEPELLNNINLIIMVNDYKELKQFQFIKKILIQNKFNHILSRPCENEHACKKVYYQTWKK
jgi:FkbM family methyltransferase